MKTLVEPSGARAHISLPGIPLDYYDRSGNWSIAKLQGLLTSVRFHAYHSPSPDTGRSFLEYDTLTEQCFTFMASTKTEITQDFYTLADSDSRPDLAVSVQLGYIGTSSLSSVARLYHKETGKVFVKNVNQVVTVDKGTRKPKPLPDWWKTKYASYVEGDEKLIVPTIPVPEACHTFRMRTLWGDMDRYKHINYVAYIRYCMEAAMDAIVSGGYQKKFTSDIVDYQMKSMQILYKGESKPGEELDISTWQNEASSDLLHFDIKKNGQTIFQNSMEFY